MAKQSDIYNRNYAPIYCDYKHGALIYLSGTQHEWCSIIKS